MGPDQKYLLFSGLVDLCSVPGRMSVASKMADGPSSWHLTGCHDSDVYAECKP